MDNCRVPECEREVHGDGLCRRHYDRAYDGRPVESRGYRQNVLTWADVGEIRRRKAEGETNAALAKAYGVSRQNISLICRNLTWRTDAE